MVIYGIGKKMYHEDKVVGVLSALFYAFFGLIIVTSPFSSGTGYAFICFFAALATYFLVCAIKAADAGQYQAPMDVLKDRKVMLNTVLGGIMFGVTVLSWTDFWMFMVVAAVIMFIVALARRIAGKDLWTPVLIADIFLGIGIICGAAWYGAVGQWDAVASGAVVLGLLTIVYATAFAAVQKKPWVITVPVFAVVMIVVGVAIMFLDGDLSHAIFHGNTAYENSLMQDLADTATRTSISEMAGYYGWLTLWFPFILGCYMLYRYRRDGGSMLYGFSLLYIFSMFFVGWFDSGYATVAGPAFAVSCGILSMIVIRGVDMKGYFRSLRGNGVKAGARKALKFFPFCTILVAVFLIIVPNAVYAVDAATPSNDEKAGYYGGLSYDIQTTDSSETAALWSYYSDVDTDGAIVTWMGNSNYAAEAGFSSVTDTYGNGATTMSQIYLADSSAKAVAVMTIRMVLHYDAASFDSQFTAAGLTADEAAELESLIDDADAAQAYVKENYSDFPGVSVNSLTDENAIYYAASDYMVDHLTEQEIESLYASVLSQSGKSGIQYIELDGSMLPLYYNDSSSFSTIAYFGNYTLGTYNAATQFFSYNSYYGYTTYTDAMYETFLWNALIGIDASDYSSSYSLISALATADSSVTVSPLTGISGFQIVYWHLMYNPDDSATNSSSGWVEMDAYEAIAKQRSEGGVINYLSSVMLLEYVGDNDDYSTSYSSYSGTVTGSDGAVVEGIEVAVYVYNSDLQKYVRGSTAYTDSEGKYTITVPNGTDYYVSYYAGATTARNGTVFKTITDDITADTDLDVTLDAVELTGTVTVSGNSCDVTGTVTLVGQTSGREYTLTLASGAFDTADTSSTDSSISIIPDKYDATVYSSTGAEVGTGTLVATATTTTAQLDLSGGKITVTVTAMDYSDVTGVEVTLTETTSGVTFTGTVGSDGTAVIYVTAGTYSGSVNGASTDNGYWIGASTSNTTMSSSGYSRTMSITVYPMVSVSISNGSGSQGIVSAVGYSGYTVDGTTAYLPFTLNEVTYTIYQLSNGSIYYATVTANDTDTTLTADLGTTASTAYTVSGTVKDSDGSGISATVYFIKSDDGAVFAYSSDSDGAYTAYLPEGTYTVYAYGSSQASYSTLDVTADATNDISLETAYSATLAVDYNTNRSSTSTYRYIPFAEVQEEVTIDSTTYTFSVLTSLGSSTSTTGRAAVWVPEGASVTATVNGYDTVAFDAAGVVTLYAQWTVNSYTLEYDKNADDATWDLSSSSGTYDYDTTVTILSGTSGTDYTYDGYTFIGWNTESDGSGTWYSAGQSVSGLTATDGGTVTLYAQWVSSTDYPYVVIYDGNGGSAIEPTTSSSSSVTLSTDSPSRAGYSFLGWATTADATAEEYEAGGSYTVASTDTLYAVWSSVYTYTVEFDANGGTGTMDSLTGTYGTSLTLTDNTMTYEGYTFLGWNTSSSGTGTWYADGQSVINLSS
ncbi:MAG: InlB B-repeat-containing protein, partial [Fastidiosipilaceae bacterium]